MTTNKLINQCPRVLLVRLYLALPSSCFLLYDRWAYVDLGLHPFTFCLYLSRYLSAFLQPAARPAPHEGRSPVLKEREVARALSVTLNICICRWYYPHPPIVQIRSECSLVVSTVSKRSAAWNVKSNAVGPNTRCDLGSNGAVPFNTVRMSEGVSL
jgi:hypothetical protein